MRDFLSYVVGEVVAGRGDAIRAKTIAQDVYGRDPAREDYSENIVRVDARRLRRLLDDYYNGDGQGAALRIEIAPGGYIPSFSAFDEAAGSNQTAKASVTWRSRTLVAIVGGFGAVAVVAFIVLWHLHSDAPVPSAAISEAERHALFEQSGAVLQAENLCTQGRGMLFPIADTRQQAVATDLFKRAIELAPELACGYAGAAHSLSTQALLAPAGDERDAFLSEAVQYAERGQSLAPKDGWVVSGLAWASMVDGKVERAGRLSSLSEELSPTDGNVLDFYGVISIQLGHYEKAIAATDPSRERDTFGLGHAHRNIYGVANFHSGNYDTAIGAWEDAVRLGEPVSALTLIYLAAAHQARGDHDIAAGYGQDLQDGWPQFPVRVALERLFPDEKDSAELLGFLTEAGWTDPSGSGPTGDDG